MAVYLAVDPDGEELIFDQVMPYRQDGYWYANYD